MPRYSRIEFKPGRVIKTYLDAPEVAPLVPPLWAAAHEAHVLRVLAVEAPDAAPGLFRLSDCTIEMGDAGISLAHIPGLLDTQPGPEKALLAIGEGLLMVAKRMAYAGVVSFDPNPGNVCIAYINDHLHYKVARVIDHQYTHVSGAAPLDKPVLLEVDNLDANRELAPEARQLVKQGQQNAAQQMGYKDFETLIRTPGALLFGWDALQVDMPVLACDTLWQYAWGRWMERLTDECAHLLLDRTYNQLRPLIERATLVNPANRHGSLDDLLKLWRSTFVDLPAQSELPIERPRDARVIETSVVAGVSTANATAVSSSASPPIAKQAVSRGIAFLWSKLPRWASAGMAVLALLILSALIYQNRPTPANLLVKLERQKADVALKWLGNGVGSPPEEHLQHLILTAQHDKAVSWAIKLQFDKLSKDLAVQLSEGNFNSIEQQRMAALGQAGLPEAKDWVAMIEGHERSGRKEEAQVALNNNIKN